MKKKLSKQYQKGRLLIVDGSNLAYRAYFVYHRPIRTKDGQKPGMVYGFLKMLRQYVHRFSARYLLVVFDTSEAKHSNFKNHLLESYKETRDKKRIDIDYELLDQQISHIRDVLGLFKVPVVWDKEGLGHEADDYVAYFSMHHNGRVIIVSSDKDFCQLIDKRVKVFNPSKDKILCNRNCFSVMGYKPTECVDYLCLVGDKSDNIPGYIGIGEVKARKFLDEFGSIQNFLDSDGEFPGIEKEGLKDLYERNKPIIDLREALKQYPIKKNKVPMERYYLKNQPHRKVTFSMKELFKLASKYYLEYYLDEKYVEPFKKLKRWHETLK